MASRNFCTTAELAAELGDADLGVIDASWHLPNTGRIGAAEFRHSHIPGAVFFDIDAIADLDQGLPHMLPKPETLAKEMSALGLGDGMRFVVYDALGLFAAARVWWTLRAYGVERDPHSRGRPAEMDQGGAAARGGRSARRGGLASSRRASTRASSPRSRTCARRLRAARRRWSTRVPPTASAAKRRSRGRA